MTFGDKIKQYRFDNDLSQEELADMLGTTKQVISRYENEQRTPKITVAVEYARIMGVEPGDLIDDERELYQSSRGVKYAAKMSHGLSVDDLTEDDILAVEQFIEFTRERRKREKNNPGGDT